MVDNAAEAHNVCSKACGQHRTLSSLSGEALGLMASYLAHSDLVHLREVGSRLLAQKTRDHLEHLTLELGPMAKWPLDAFKHPRLVSLRVLPALEGYYHPLCIPKEGLLPLIAHSWLNKLEVRFCSAIDLLHVRPPSESLTELYPNLESLIIWSRGYFDASYLLNLPPRLTEFHLQVVPPNPSEDLPTLDISKMPALPPKLTNLRLMRQPLRSQSPETWKEFLPPTLTSLYLCPVSVSGLLQALPTGVLHLTMDTTADSTRYALLEPVPSSLITLHVLSSPMAFYKTQPFPSTLKTLILPRGVHVADSVAWRMPPPSDEVYGIRRPVFRAPGPGKLALLPPSLTRIEGIDVGYEHKRGSWLPDLKKADTKFDQPIGLFAEEVLLNDTYSKTTGLWMDPLPLTITKLTATVFEKDLAAWTRNLGNMVALKELSLERPSTALLPQVWLQLHTRLESISFCINGANSLADIAGPWTNLSTMKLEIPTSTQVSRVWQDISRSTDAQVTYPTTLKSLKLTIGSHLAMFTPECPNLTSLTSLCIEELDWGHKVYDPPNFGRDAYPILRTLPASLKELSLLLNDECFRRSLRKHQMTLEEVLTTSRPEAQYVLGWSIANLLLSPLPPKLCKLVVQGRFLDYDALVPLIPQTLAHTNLNLLNQRLPSLALQEEFRQTKRS